jgi:hypothetical protein
VDEQAEYVPIVREPDVRRMTVAARAVLDEFDRVRDLVGHRPEILAYLYAGSAVRSDDDHGRGSGLVVQADEMRWSELEELVRLAEAQLASGRHAGLGHWHPDCRDCQAVLAIARIRARYRYRTIGTDRSLDPRSQPAGGGPGGPGGPGGSRPSGTPPPSTRPAGDRPVGEAGGGPPGPVGGRPPGDRPVGGGDGGGGRAGGPASGAGLPGEGGTANPGRGPP